MTLNEFIKWIGSFSDIPEWSRLGQYAFNSLAATHADIAEKYRGTMLDPYHFNDRVKPLIEVILRDHVR